MIARHSPKCAEILDFGRYVWERRREPAHLLAGRPRRSTRGNIDGPSEPRSRAYGPGDRPEPQFLVDDGVACPPDCRHASRKGLPVRNDLGIAGADRRLAQRTGEFGIVQI